MSTKRGKIIATTVMAGALGILPVGTAKADEVCIPMTQNLQLRLSDDFLPVTMSPSGKVKLYHVGIDLELKLEDWFIPYFRVESSVFDYELSGRSSRFPLRSNPEGGLESGVGLLIPISENKIEKTRLDTDAYCGVNEIARKHCFVGLRYRF